MSMLARCSATENACSASASRNLASATSLDEEEELKVVSALEVLGLGVVCSGPLPTTTDMAVKCWSVRALLSAGDSGSPLEKVASMPDDSNGSGVQPVGSIVHRGACQRATADYLCSGYGLHNQQPGQHVSVSDNVLTTAHSKPRDKP